MKHNRSTCHHCRKHDNWRSTFCPEDGRACYTPDGPEPEGFRCANYDLCKSFERNEHVRRSMNIQEHLKPDNALLRSHEDADSGMDGDSVARAEWFWAQLPVNRTWAGLATYEKALVCHLLASADTHPKGGNSVQHEVPAPLSGAVGEAETPNPSPNPSGPSA